MNESKRKDLENDQNKNSGGEGPVPDADSVSGRRRDPHDPDWKLSDPGNRPSSDQTGKKYRGDRRESRAARAISLS